MSSIPANDGDEQGTPLDDRRDHIRVAPGGVTYIKAGSGTPQLCRIVDFCATGLGLAAADQQVIAVDEGEAVTVGIAGLPPLAGTVARVSDDGVRVGVHLDIDEATQETIASRLQWQINQDGLTGNGAELRRAPRAAPLSRSGRVLRTRIGPSDEELEAVANDDVEERLEAIVYNLSASGMLLGTPFEAEPDDMLVVAGQLARVRRVRDATMAIEFIDQSPQKHLRVSF